MSDEQYFTLLERIESQLSKPTLLRAHAIIFGFGVPIFRTLTAMASLNDRMNAAVYLGVMVWCLVLGVHATWTYLRSGALRARREKVIRETLLDFGDEYELSTDEMVELHERLSHDVQQDAVHFTPVIGAISGSIGLWIGMFFVALLLSVGQSLDSKNLFLMLQGVPVVGTFLLTLGMVLSPLVLQRKDNKDALRAAQLRAIYSRKATKRKREFNNRLVIDDEGEIVLNEDVSRKTKTSG